MNGLSCAARLSQVLYIVVRLPLSLVLHDAMPGEPTKVLCHGLSLLLAIGCLVGLFGSSRTVAQVPSLDAWSVHDPDRPTPPIVSPGPPGAPVPPPSDAVVLLDGTSLDQWERESGGPAGWTLKDGYMEVPSRGGAIRTRRSFGDVQLHVEFAAPNSGDGQNSGNSGVFLMGLYEVQVLNSFENQTYADGQAAALYGQYPPLVNASRSPMQWQTYDIVFRRPRFDANGTVEAPAYVTVFHNGVLVQDHVALTGPTAHRARPPYRQHADRLPLSLQDHNEPVRYRNIWVRELE